MEFSSPEQSPDNTVISTNQSDLIEKCSLVLSAKGISHHIRQNIDGKTQIIVAVADVESAKYQVSRYIEENRNWPPPQVVVRHPSFPSFLPTI